MDRGNWIAHRRDDGELVGWMRPEGEHFIVIDLLGREVTGPIEWLAAEETLDALGIGYLADPYILQLPDSSEMRVRIIQVSSTGIVVKRDDGGAIGGPRLHYNLGFPAPGTLRPLLPSDSRRTGW